MTNYTPKKVINNVCIDESNTLSNSFLNMIIWSLQGKWPYKNVLESSQSFGEKKFYLYGNDVFLFKYNSKEEQQQDMIAWKKKFKKKNTLSSETIDGRQILEPSWCFEFQWKYYLLWYLYQDSNHQDNDEANWVYNGIIINHKRYFQVENESTNISKTVKNIVP